MPDQSAAKFRAQVTGESALRRQPRARTVVIIATRSMRNAATRWNSRRQALPHPRPRDPGPLVGWVRRRRPHVRTAITRSVAVEGRVLQRTIKAVIRPGEESGFVGECLEIAVVTQAQTLDDVCRNLREAVELHLADEDLEALGLSPDPTIIVTMELTPEHA